MMTGVPSGSPPTATAITAAAVPGQRLPDRGAVGQPPHPHRAVAPPLMMTGVPSGSRPAATANTAPSWPRSGSPTGVPSASRHTRTVPSAAAADDDRGAVRQRPGRHRIHRAGVAVQRLPDRGAVGQPPHPHRAVARRR